MIEIIRPEDELRPQFEAFRNRLFAIAADSIERATVPIVHGEGENLLEGRSGLLLQIDQSQYLITAGHSMVDHLGAGRRPQVVMSKTDKHPIILHEEDIYTTNDSHLDLAIIQLRPSTAEYLSRHSTCLRLDTVMLSRDRRQGMGMYMLAGFPIANLDPRITEGSHDAGYWLASQCFNGAVIRGSRKACGSRLC